MKNYKKLIILAAAAGLAIANSASAATLINTYPTSGTSNITVTQSSIEPNTSVNGGDRTVIQDNNGFNPATGEHASGTQQSWRSSDSGTIADQWIQWDLGASFELDSIQLWNYNDASRFASGVRQVDIFVAESFTGDPLAAQGSEASGNGWTLYAADAILSVAPGAAGYTGFDLETVVGSALPTSDIQFVRFEVDSTFRSDAIDVGGGLLDGANVAGLAQIEFSQVPEPSSFTLMALGLGGLVLLRRCAK